MNIYIYIQILHSFSCSCHYIDVKMKLSHYVCNVLYVEGLKPEQPNCPKMPF